MENGYKLGPHERTILRMIEQAGDQAGHLTVDRILRGGDTSPNRVRDLVLAGCCELCDHPTERDPHDRPSCAVCITEAGRIALTQPPRLH